MRFRRATAGADCALGQEGIELWADADRVLDEGGADDARTAYRERTVRTRFDVAREDGRSVPRLR